MHPSDPVGIGSTADGHHVLAFKVGDTRALGRNECQRLCHFVGSHVRNIASVEQYLARIAAVESCYGSEQRRLARAVAADKRCQRAFRDSGLHFVEQRALSIADGKIVQLYHAVKDVLRNTTHTTIGIPNNAVMAFIGRVKNLETRSQRSSTAAPERIVPGTNTR